MSYLAGNYITDSGKKWIKEYKYKSGEYSLLDKLFNHFWEVVVTWCPAWLAPNTITLLGFIANLLLYQPILFYDMSMTKEVPAFALVLNWLGIFVFQTLDAIDGKQARRTNSSSSLGQLFDHGCDAISWTICSTGLISVLRFGICFNSILLFVASTAPFYLINMMEMYSGVYVYDNAPGTDSTSAQIYLMIFNLLPVIFGPDVYSYKMKELLPWVPSWITAEFVLCDLVVVIIAYFGIVFTIIMITKCIKGSRQESKLVQCIFLMGSFSMIYIFMLCFDSNIQFIKDHAALVFFWFSALYCIICTKLIICLMAKMHYSWVHYEYGVWLIYFYFQYQYDGSAESETKLKWAFYGTFVLLWALYLRLVSSCISQLTEYLNIYCFSIQKRKIKSK